MAASCTVTHRYLQKLGGVRKITWAWTSASDGSCTGPTIEAVGGEIVRIVTIPSASAAPTTLYDITITDGNSIDVMAGQGANLSATVTAHVMPGVPLKDGTTTSVAPIIVDDILTLNVTNAGDTKSGTVIMYLRTQNV